VVLGIESLMGSASAGHRGTDTSARDSGGTQAQVQEDIGELVGELPDEVFKAVRLQVLEREPIQGARGQDRDQRPAPASSCA
jgi:hypothetical protein